VGDGGRRGMEGLGGSVEEVGKGLKNKNLEVI
jgi:hypothetical protein